MSNLPRRVDRLECGEPMRVVIAPPGVHPHDHHRDAYGSDPRVIVLPDGAQRL